MKTENLECALERIALAKCARKRVLENPAAYGAITEEAAAEVGLVPDPTSHPEELEDAWAESEILWRADDVHRRG